MSVRAMEADAVTMAAARLGESVTDTRNGRAVGGGGAAWAVA